MPKSREQGLMEEHDDLPELPGLVNEVVARDGVSSEERGEGARKSSAVGFSREDFLDMQGDRDFAPSMAGDDEDSYIPLGTPAKAYFTVHHDPAYEWKCAVTYDFRKSNNKMDPFIVLRPMWSKFPKGFLRTKRLLLCQSYVDDTPKRFLWLADWYESGESPSEWHKSVARTIAKGREGWGQAPFVNGLYTWRRWSEYMGPEPVILWPDDRDMYAIVSETFRDRIIQTPDHELILSLGKERP